MAVHDYRVALAHERFQPDDLLKQAPTNSGNARRDMNVSGADPHAALRFCGDKVLPELREG